MTAVTVQFEIMDIVTDYRDIIISNKSRMINLNFDAIKRMPKVQILAAVSVAGLSTKLTL